MRLTAIPLALLVTGLACARERPEPSLTAGSTVELSSEELARSFAEISSLRAHPGEGSLRSLLILSRHGDHLVRIRSVRALGERDFIANDDARARVIEALEDPNWVVRATAAKALVKSPVPAARPALERRLPVEDSSKVRSLIEEALRAIDASG